MKNGAKHSQESIEKIRKSSIENPRKYWEGKKFSEGHRKKLSMAKRGRKLSMAHRIHIAESNKGEKSHLWRGGKTSLNKLIRSRMEYFIWRSSVFERDNWTCQTCNLRGVYLEAHHVKSLAEYPELAFELDNGVTLCRTCHSLTDNYRGKNRIKHKV